MGKHACLGFIFKWITHHIWVKKYCNLQRLFFHNFFFSENMEQAQIHSNKTAFYWVGQEGVFSSLVGLVQRRVGRGRGSHTISSLRLEFGLPIVGEEGGRGRMVKAETVLFCLGLISSVLDAKMGPHH